MAEHPNAGHRRAGAAVTIRLTAVKTAALYELPRLVGEPVTTPRDPSLADAVARRDVRIEEELSLDTLLADLT